MEETDMNVLLHVLRNPSGWNDDVIRGVRVQAADELERLWGVERASKFALSTLNQAHGSGQKAAT